MVYWTCDQCGCYSKNKLLYHQFWGFRPLNFPVTPPDFFASPNDYKTYLHKAVTFTGTGTGWSGTAIYDIDRLSGVYTADTSGMTAGADDGSFFAFAVIDSDTITSTVRTTTAHDFTGNYTRVETLSSEYTDAQMYDDLIALRDLTSYGTTAGISETHAATYQPGTGAYFDGYNALFTFPALAYSTTALWHRYAESDEAQSFYWDTPETSRYWANMMVMCCFKAKVRKGWSVRDNNTNNLTRAQVIGFAYASDAQAALFSDTYLPAANDTSCDVETTGDCAREDAEYNAPYFDAGQHMLFRALKRNGACPQN